MPARRAASKPLSRSPEGTRRALIEAGIAVFAEYGYGAASVRTITGRAKVNQGAITYHFGGKEGLYRDVLRTARGAMGAQPLIDLASVGTHEPAAALRLFLRQTLAPVAQGQKFKRYLRVFAWEQLKPTAVRQRLAREEPFPAVLLAGHIVRRFRPDADERTVAVATAALMAQTVTFIRDAEFLAQPPFNLRLDKQSLDALVNSLAELCLAGLGPAVKSDS